MDYFEKSRRDERIPPIGEMSRETVYVVPQATPWGFSAGYDAACRDAIAFCLCLHLFAR
jgi:hypothetical protein